MVIRGLTSAAKSKINHNMKYIFRLESVSREHAKVLGALAKLTLALLATQCWLAAQAGTFFTDFNSGQPAATSLYGTAFIDTSGGVGDSGVLKLTQAYAYGSQGSFRINDLDGGA